MTFQVTYRFVNAQGQVEFKRRYFQKLKEASRFFHSLDGDEIEKRQLLDGKGVPVTPLHPDDC